MSLKSWKEEFYPITAKQAARKSWKFALEHSMKKMGWLNEKES